MVLIRKILVTIMFLLFQITLLSNTFGQYKLNFGLDKPQDASTLPKSKTELVKTERKKKITTRTEFRKENDGYYSIVNGWELTEAERVNLSNEFISSSKIKTDDWYNATVPGTILTTLVDQGVYPDPYFGLNNLAIPDSLCRKEWWYRTEFEIPRNEKGKNIWLNFDGINYKADIWLNGILIGKIAGAFSRGIFNITKQIALNEPNYLAVHIYPPNNPGIPHEESKSAGTGPNGGKLCLDGPTFISSEGWDWIPGIRDRNIGIWQNVKIKFTGSVTIIDPQVITILPLPDTSSAEIKIKLELKNSSSEVKNVVLKGKLDKTIFEKIVSIPPNSTTKLVLLSAEIEQLKLTNPKLWWPNGYGKPNLYQLELAVYEGKSISDKKSIRFGVREFSYEISADKNDKQNLRFEFVPTKDIVDSKPVFDNITRRDVGNGVSIPKIFDSINSIKEIPNDSMTPYLVIKVNGKRVFCKGGNWGMDDGMKRVSRERLEPYFRLHKDANFTMIRNWTGESTEEVFYELADEYGLLVWNDFWLSTEGYNLEPIDNKLFLDNVEDVIKRFRNHASIAVWCPRNEGYAPLAIEKNLAEIISREDGTRLYHGNSRYLNLRPSGPWHYYKDPAEYYKNNAIGFNTELGTPCVPTAESMRKMMSSEDVWPISDAWYYHDLHNGQIEYRKAIDSLYGEPKTLDEFCKKAQMINYESHRAMFESWNSKLWNNTSGILLWMTHPAWPSTVWQVYSWDYETFGSYFASKSACEPIHVQMNLHDDKIVVVNTSLKKLNNGLVSLEVYNHLGKRIFNHSLEKNISENSLTYFFTPDLSSVSEDIYLARVILKDSNKKIISINDYWKSFRKNADFKLLNSLNNVQLSSRIIEYDKAKKILKIELQNKSQSIAVAVKLNLVDENKQVILPVYFSDGYFNLLPEEKRIIQIDNFDFTKGEIFLRAAGYNINDEVIMKIK